MIGLAEIRSDLLAALRAGGLTVFDHLPRQLHPPVVLIEPADPYISDEDPNLPHGHVNVSWTLHVIAKPGTPESQTIGLDTLIEETLAALPPSWDVGNVGQPYSLTNDQRSWLATQINASISTRY